MLMVVCLAAQCPAANAEMVSTEQVAAQQKVEVDREKLKAFVGREEVQARLQALGVQGGVAKDRVDALTDPEVAQLVRKIDSLPAGGNLSQTDIIIILLIAILVAIAL
jgi:hypothetical protein